jgi:hypothetical protein
MRAMLWLFLFCIGVTGTVFAASLGPHRLADGTPVPDGADYMPPVPEGGAMPTLRAAPGVQGRFAADLIVSPQGDVTDVVPVSRIHPQVDRTLIRRMRQVRFEPARLDGLPVAAIYRTSIEFFEN